MLILVYAAALIGVAVAAFVVREGLQTTNAPMSVVLYAVAILLAYESWWILRLTVHL
jgi:high-affinity Fe2+/Pb2+ permease